METQRYEANFKKDSFWNDISDTGREGGREAQQGSSDLVLYLMHSFCPQDRKYTAIIYQVPSICQAHYKILMESYDIKYY